MLADVGGCVCAWGDDDAGGGGRGLIEDVRGVVNPGAEGEGGGAEG